MRIVLAGLLLVFVTVGAFAAQPSGGLVIRNVHLVQAEAGLHSPADVMIRGGRIAAIEPAGSLQLQSGAEVFEGSDKYLMPGLADMHHHLLPGTFRLDGDRVEVLRSLLSWGITTVFNTGTEEDAYLAMRRATSEASMNYPRLFSTQRPLTAEAV